MESSATPNLEGQSEGAHSNYVGRIINVVDSIEGIDNPEHFATISFADDLASQQLDDNVPVQFLKVNVFSDHSVISDKLHLRQTESSQASKKNGDKTSTTWQRLVQLSEYDWIPSSAVLGLSFVFPEGDGALLSHAFDDCRGMFNAYLLTHRMDSAGLISYIPPDSCPPFPSYLEEFRKLWSVDHSQMIFNSIRQIRQDMQRSLCRVAQSQGDFAMKTTKLLVPSCCWFYIKSSLASKGMHSVSPVRYTQPRSVLSWGLALRSCPYVGSLDVIRFDTKEKMNIFRQLFGIMAGVGIRKRRPKYCDGKALLSLNDVLNIISCPDADDSNDTPPDDHDTFKRFGTTGDGIDLAYDSSEGVLQIVLRYRKMVVTNTSMNSLSSLGVLATTANNEAASLDSSSDAEIEIVPGMEFVDSMYVMRIHQVFANEIHAKQAYKINDHAAKRTMKAVHSSEIVIYTDVVNVHRQIKKMLE